MILFFHFIFLLTKYIVNSLSKSLSADKDVSNDAESTSSNESHSIVFRQESFTSESKYCDGRLKFFPPVYVQRYEAVYLVLQEPPWKDTIRKVVDFGCSELGFFLYLKHMPGVEEILEVDVDECVLERCASKAAPLNSDYLFCKRSKPLDVYLLAGSIADYDDMLLGTDAVVAIEVIEHLKPDVLEKFPYNVFHEIKPRLAIFTTPNADFNALFPNHVGFRHADHQFEWSRKEFYKWTKGITNDYPEYSVKFYGIGVGPEGTENLGCCTQMAVFERHESEDEIFALELKGVNNYKLIRKYDYPFYVDTRTDTEKILDEVIYRLKFSIDTTRYACEDYFAEVPLSEFMDHISQWCQSEEQLKKILVEHGFYVKEKEGVNVLVHCDARTESGESMEEGSSTEFDLNETLPNVEHEPENWDWDCGDGNLNCVLSDKAAEEDIPNFLSARSLQEITEQAAVENATGRTNLGILDYSESVATDKTEDNSSESETSYNLRFDEVAQFSRCRRGPVEPRQIGDGKSRSVTLSKIPRKKNIGDTELKNSSKSAKTLVR